MIFFDLFRRKSRKNAPLAAQDPKPVAHEGPTHSADKFGFDPAATLSDVLTFIRDNAAFSGIELKEPATDAEIRHFESQKVKLPKDFKALYQFSNGFESDAYLFRLIPLDEILDNEKNGRGAGSASFHFTEYMIYADMWTVETGANDVDQYIIYNEADSIVHLTNSLAEFLCVFLNKGVFEGLYNWREEKDNA